MTFEVHLTNPQGEDLIAWEYPTLRQAIARYSVLVEDALSSGSDNAITVYRDGEEIDV